MKLENFDLWCKIFEYIDIIDRRCFLSVNRQVLMTAFYRFSYHCSQEQQQIIYGICFTKNNFIITGRPGTGKSYLILIALKLLTWMGIVCQTSAYTGIAAVNCEGQTLHQLFPLHKYNECWDERNNCPLRKHIHRDIPPFEILFLDEVSMICPITADILEYLNKPYNIRIVCSGDFKQLPPVACKSKTRKYFFESILMANCIPKTLTKVFRQDNENFIQIINSVGDNDYDNNVWTFFAQRQQAYLQLSDDEKLNIPHLYFDNKRVNEWNMKCFNQLQGQATHVVPFILYIMKTTIFYETQDYKTEQIAIPATIYDTLKKVRIFDVHMKIGMKLMLTKNFFDFPITSNKEQYDAIKADRDLKIKYTSIDLANGTQGILLGIFEHGVLLFIKDYEVYFPLTFYRVQIEAKKTKHYRYNTIARVRYYPFVLCYALTIHKSQGLTLDKAIMSLKNLSSPELCYVAISRVKKLENLFLIDYGFPKKEFDNKLLKYFKDPLIFGSHKKHPMFEGFK